MLSTQEQKCLQINFSKKRFSYSKIKVTEEDLYLVYK